jgi:hypothetical protein
MRRVAPSLDEQGDFTRAVEAYRALIAQAPTDTGAITAQLAIIDIYQNRMLEPERAQEARLDLAAKFGPGSTWAQANPTPPDSLVEIREVTLRQAAQFALAEAQQRNDRERYARAASLYEQ